MTDNENISSEEESFLQNDFDEVDEDEDQSEDEEEQEVQEETVQQILRWKRNIEANQQRIPLCDVCGSQKIKLYFINSYSNHF